MKVNSLQHGFMACCMHCGTYPSTPYNSGAPLGVQHIRLKSTEFHSLHQTLSTGKSSLRYHRQRTLAFCINLFSPLIGLLFSSQILIKVVIKIFLSNFYVHPQRSSCCDKIKNTNEKYTNLCVCEKLQVWYAQITIKHAVQYRTRKRFRKSNIYLT